MIVKMEPYTIRPFNPTSEEYDAIVQVYNQANLFEHGSAASWQHWDNHRDPGGLFRRYVVARQDTIVGYGFSMRPDTAVNRFQFAIFVPPAQQTPGIISDFYTYIVNACGEYDPVGFISRVREDEAAKIDWLARNGFQPVMRYPRSILYVPDFDAAPYARLFTKLAAKGIEIVSLAELSKRDLDWQRRIYDLEMVINQDVPSPHPFSPPPFSAYAQREFEDPEFMPEGWFVAVADGQYVGTTTLDKVSEDVDLLHTKFTGVHRAYRRRGIASALKVRAIQFAQSLGARLILANNEENNPMFQLNLALGFQPQPADVDWERSK